MQGAVEKTSKGFQFVRKNKATKPPPAAKPVKDGSVSRTRRATTKTTTRRRSSVSRGRSLRRSLMETGGNPADILVQFHEDVPETVPPPERLATVLSNCVDHALRNADIDDLKAAGGTDMVEAFIDMYTAKLGDDGVFKRLTQMGDPSEIAKAKMSAKEIELCSQISAYEAALESLETEKGKWAALEADKGDSRSTSAQTIAPQAPSAWQEAFLAGQLDVSGLPATAASAAERLLLQIDQLHRNVMALKYESDEVDARLDQQADTIMRGGTVAAAPATPRHTILNILDPPQDGA